MPAGEFPGVEQVGEFGLPVPCPRGAGAADIVLGGFEGREGDPRRRVGAGCDGCQGHHPRRGRRLLEGGKEEFEKQGVRQVVDPEMLLVAVRSETRGHGHDAGVEDQSGEGAGLRQ